MHWKMAEAKQQLSRLVHSAATEPQWIQNRDVVVAAVISAAEAEAFLEWKKQSAATSVADELDELGLLTRSEAYSLEPPARVDRENPLAPKRAKQRGRSARAR